MKVFFNHVICSLDSKKGHSTTQCTAIVEVINYYKNRNSSVYVVMLDASQSFDRANLKVIFALF